MRQHNNWSTRRSSKKSMLNAKKKRLIHTFIVFDLIRNWTEDLPQSQQMLHRNSTSRNIKSWIDYVIIFFFLKLLKYYSTSDNLIPLRDIDKLIICKCNRKYFLFGKQKKLIWSCFTTTTTFNVRNVHFNFLESKTSLKT